MFVLKTLIKEILQNVVYHTRDELIKIISQMLPDEISQFDYIDDDSGEIVLEKGEKARDCYLHPQYQLDRKAHVDQIKNDLENWDNETIGEQSLLNTITVFVENLDIEDLKRFDDLQSAISDVAETYFVTHPDWKYWAADCLPPRTKRDIKEQIIDLIFEKTV